MRPNLPLRLRISAKINSDCHARSLWSTPAGERFRERLAFESGSKLRALQTLREVGRHSITQRAGIC
ncbi:hypothetical protein SBV1_2150012 [Verrucomicrobia bacterium]|nr:hypothetical protein SBV1_2150012 [Verrucomicrobiota bacterium]